MGIPRFDSESILGVTIRFFSDSFKSKRFDSETIFFRFKNYFIRFKNDFSIQKQFTIQKSIQYQDLLQSAGMNEYIYVAFYNCCNLCKSHESCQALSYPGREGTLLRFAGTAKKKKNRFFENENRF